MPHEDWFFESSLTHVTGCDYEKIFNFLAKKMNRIRKTFVSYKPVMLTKGEKVKIIQICETLYRVSGRRKINLGCKNRVRG